jgi:hypothetical protein
MSDQDRPEQDRPEQDRPSPDYLYPDWQPQVQAALIELDPLKLRDRIEAADLAVSRRLQSISLNPNHHAERLAISDAVATLRFLRREYLDPSNPQQK